VAEVDRGRVDAMSTVPLFAARSSVTLPEVLVNLPRQTEMPKWPASKLG
jgi:hypothetical protein